MGAGLLAAWEPLPERALPGGPRPGNDCRPGFLRSRNSLGNYNSSPFVNQHGYIWNTSISIEQRQHVWFDGLTSPLARTHRQHLLLLPHFLATFQLGSRLEATGSIRDTT